MEPGSTRREKRAMCIVGNYSMDRNCIDDGGCGERPRFGVAECSGQNGESPRGPGGRSRLGGDRPVVAGNPRRGDTPMWGGYCLDHTAKKPNAIDMEDDRRSSGILHGRMVTTGVDDRPEVSDCGVLPGFGRSLQCIIKEREDNISAHHPQWGEVARKSRSAYTL